MKFLSPLLLLPLLWLNGVAAFASAPISSIHIAKKDCVVVLAPHPDDESLAAGGIIQEAMQVGAEVHVVVATNGDNNPWPQRILEQRIVLHPADQKRWGARRKKEVAHAVAALGLPANHLHFLGFHDGGTTNELMTNPSFTKSFASLLATWKPTILVIPSRDDLHPDHNACFILARHAIASPSERHVTILEYPVHGKFSSGQAVSIALHGNERDVKRKAILAHKSQVALSRRKLVAFAKSSETFYTHASPDESATHPISHASVTGDVLKMRLHALPDGKIYLVGFRLHRPLRAVIHFHPHERNAIVRDSLTGQTLAAAQIERAGDSMEISATLSHLSAPLFAKLELRGFFLDKSGWREIPVR